MNEEQKREELGSGDKSSSIEDADSEVGEEPKVNAIYGKSMNLFGRESFKVEIFDEDIPDILPTIWRKKSQIATCTHCKLTIETKTKKEAGFGCLLFFSSFLAIGGCCWIPCIFPMFRDTVHYCPKCKNRLGCRSFL
ncbi:unnamed protein product [Blepharisma stoltei]|uniref:LITAF domain-containing protein n=1 Tax=Blepharisma stoltei TaxID=1481888 RepID=A0AAU9K9N7_9CILI|nr:unnamed protein product [Blepharisma stoltei]